MNVSQVSSMVPNVVMSANPVIFDAKATQQTETFSIAISSKDQTAEQFNDSNYRKNIEQFANTILDGTDTQMAFKYDDQVRDWYAVIQNESTGEVIRQIPSKEVLALRANLREMIGVFLDKKI